MSYNRVKYEALIKQYLRSILDISEYHNVGVELELKCLLH